LGAVASLGAIALAVCVPRTAAAGDDAVTRIETRYADWLDATAAVATIDSGLTPRIDGRGRSVWETRRLASSSELATTLAALDLAALGAADARAVAAMRKGLGDNALETADTDPRRTWIRCADRFAPAAEDPAPLQRALYACFDEIGDQIAFEGRTIVRTTALQRLQEIADEPSRKHLFMAFSPLWTAVNGEDTADSPYRRMMASAAASAARDARSPITDAAATVGITPAQIEDWLIDILSAWRMHSPDRPIEPWNYWYSNAAASRELAAAIPRDSVLPISRRFYRDLGADLNALGVRHDLTVRPGKAPLAYADHLRIGRRIGTAWRPAVPRVSANYEQGGLFVLNELIHEDGHAVHDAALRVRPAFYSLGEDLFVEAFADVPAWSSAEPAWQEKYLGRSAAEAAAIRELMSNVILDVAWALFDLRMLKNPRADPNAVWTEITSRYLNIAPHPEISWWALRVQLARWPGYMINYGLGAVVTADIRQRTRESIGSFDTGNAGWYGWTSQHLLRFGSSLESVELLRRFLGRPVSTAALLTQLQRLGANPARVRELRPDFDRAIRAPRPRRIHRSSRAA
jgi:hypothetical protein